MLIFLAAAIVVLAIGLAYVINDNLKWKNIYLKAQYALDAKPQSRSESKKSEPAKANKTESSQPSKADKKADAKLTKALSETKDEVKALKTQVYELKNENKDLKGEVEDLAKPAVGNDALFELRQELAEAKAQVAALGQKPARAAAPTPAPVADKVVADAPVERAPREARVADADEIKELRKRYEAEIREVRNEANAAVNDLKSKMRATSQNTEKQRRRADNNDRAFKITQLQLDAVQERTVLLEGELRRHGIISEEDVAQAALRAAAIAEGEEAARQADARAEARELAAAAKAEKAEAAAEADQNDAVEAEAKAAAEKAESEAKAAAEKAAAEKAESEVKAAAEKAESEAKAAEKAESEAKAAAEKAAAEKAESEAKAAAEKAAAEKAESEAKAAAEKAESEAKVAAEKAESEAKAAAEKIAAEAKAAAEHAATETIKHAPVPADVVDSASKVSDDDGDDGGKTEMMSVSAFAIPEVSESDTKADEPTDDSTPSVSKTEVFSGSSLNDLIKDLPDEDGSQDPAKRTAFGMRPAAASDDKGDASVDDAWSDLE